MKKPVVLAITSSYQLGQLFDEALQASYDLIIASSGPDALALIDRYPPDIFISDQYLSGISVSDVIQTAAKKNPDVYVFIMTSDKPNRTNQDQLFAMGAESIFFRPFSTKQLKMRIDHYLDRQPAHQTLS